MKPLESSVSEATIWSVTLELSMMILEASFNSLNMLKYRPQEAIGHPWGRPSCISQEKNTCQILLSGDSMGQIYVLQLLFSDNLATTEAKGKIIVNLKFLEF